MGRKQWGRVPRRKAIQTQGAHRGLSVPNVTLHLKDILHSLEMQKYLFWFPSLFLEILFWFIKHRNSQHWKQTFKTPLWKLSTSCAIKNTSMKLGYQIVLLQWRFFSANPVVLQEYTHCHTANNGGFKGINDSLTRSNVAKTRSRVKCCLFPKLTLQNKQNRTKIPWEVNPRISPRFLHPTVLAC